MKFTTKVLNKEYDSVLGIDLDDCENSVMNPPNDQLFDILVLTKGGRKYEVMYNKGKITTTQFR